MDDPGIDFDRYSQFPLWDIDPCDFCQWCSNGCCTIPADIECPELL